MGQMGKAAGCHSGSIQSCERLKGLMGIPQKKSKQARSLRKTKIVYLHRNQIKDLKV